MNDVGSLFGAEAHAIAERAEAAQWDGWHDGDKADAPHQAPHAEAGDDANGDVSSLFVSDVATIASRAQHAFEHGIEVMDRAIKAASHTPPMRNKIAPPWRATREDTLPAERTQPTADGRPSEPSADTSPAASTQPAADGWSTVEHPPLAHQHVPRVVPPPPRKVPPPQRPVQTSAPVAQSVELTWDQVLYWPDHEGHFKLDHKTRPCDPPFPDMEFKGYYFTDAGKVANAWFVKRGATGPGTRRPNRGSGGNYAWKRQSDIGEANDSKRPAS